MKIFADAYLTLSYINTKLRDHYSNLSDLCEDLCLSLEDVTNQLKKIGYVYDEKNNVFINQNLNR